MIIRIISYYFFNANNTKTANYRIFFYFIDLSHFMNLRKFA
jgi:hypothetical protein